MSQSLIYNACDVCAKFKNKEEMNKRVNAFVKEVEKWDKHCKDVDYEDDLVGALVSTEDDLLLARIYLDDDGTNNYDTDKLAELICKHFPTATGTIGWASVDLRHGYCSYANGGTTEIKDGKVVRSADEKLQDVCSDFEEALDYISEVVGHGDITECGVAHLFKKYCPEEYKEALKNKRGK